jgi:hypothetical protein
VLPVTQTEILVHEVLREAVLAVIADNPGVNATAIVKLLPKTFFRPDILACLRGLQNEGVISIRKCRHCIIAEPTASMGAPTELPGTRYVSSGFIAPVPKARLMSRR